MIHDPLHDTRVIAEVEDLARRRRPLDGPSSPPRPRRRASLRRRGAAMLIRGAERLAGEPASTLIARSAAPPRRTAHPAR